MYNFNPLDVNHGCDYHHLVCHRIISKSETVIVSVCPNYKFFIVTIIINILQVKSMMSQKNLRELMELNRTGMSQLQRVTAIMM